MEPKPGDLIHIDRGLYYHWAVYVGNGYVVHLLGPGISGSCSKKSRVSVWGKVQKEKLLDVVGNDKWRVNNLHDKKWNPRPAQEIVKEALSWVGKDVKYSIDSWNCEHFATKCRYGQSESIQARVLRGAGTAAAAAAVGAVCVLEAPLVVVAAGTFLIVQGAKNILDICFLSKSSKR